MALFKNDEELVQLQQENEKLKAAVKELSVLNELSAVINSTMSLQMVMDKVVSGSVKALNAEQGTINLLEKESQGQEDALFKTLIRKADQTEPVNKFRLDVELSMWMKKNMKPLLVNNFEENKQFYNREAEDLKIRSLLTVPLVCKGQLIGVLNLFNKKGTGEFTENDRRLLTIIASQSAQVIENARLYEQEKNLQRIEQELEMARSIQQRLLPKESPNIKGFDVAGLSYPAKEVGGDYFDFIEFENGNWCIVLGDVSGKGVPASLLMSNLQATMRYLSSGCETFIECVSKANNFLCKNTAGNRFVTLFGGIIDVAKKQFHYVNAGHNYPLYLKENGEIEQLKEGGLVLGMLPDTPYQGATVNLNSGDTIVIFSDGVTEADNPQEEMYGEKRVSELLLQNKNGSAEQISSALFDSVKEFGGDKEQDDDITVVVIKAK